MSMMIFLLKNSKIQEKHLVWKEGMNKLIAVTLLWLVVIRSKNDEYYLHWYAPVYSPGGYSSEALAYLKGLQLTNLSANIEISQHGDTPNQEYVRGLTKSDQDILSKYDIKRKYSASKRIICVCHSEPGAWSTPQPRYYTNPCPPKDAVYRIGRTMFETDSLPSGWKERLNYMNEIWVPTEFSKQIFTSSGLKSAQVKVIHESVDTDFFQPKLIQSSTFSNLPYKERTLFESIAHQNYSAIFLFVGKFEKRKGIELLIKSYFKEFRKDDSTLLLLLTSAYHSDDDFDNQIHRMLRNNQLIDGNCQPDEMMTCPMDNDSPSYKIISGLSQMAMPYLYSIATVLVIPSHGEGWGRPHIESMSCGVPVIATNWSGPTQFIIDHSRMKSNGYLIRVDEMIPAEGWVGHKWALPNEGHLQHLMRYITNNLDEVRERGRQARIDVVEKYSLRVIGEKIEAEFNRIVTDLQLQELQASVVLEK